MCKIGDKQRQKISLFVLVDNNKKGQFSRASSSLFSFIALQKTYAIQSIRMQTFASCLTQQIS